MSKIWTAFLNDCEMALNDEANAIWSRTKIYTWGEEAVLACPILLPQQYSILLVAPSSIIDLPTNFRDMITVEYPIGQTPTSYMKRMSRLDPNFFSTPGAYDVDYKYSTTIFALYMSEEVPAGATVKVNYLANHTVGIADDGAALMTIRDEHLHIPLTYVIMKAYQERLSTYMQDPTAYSQIINQMVTSVTHIAEIYQQHINTALERLASSRQTPRQAIDKYDVVY